MLGLVSGQSSVCEVGWGRMSFGFLRPLCCPHIISEIRGKVVVFLQFLLENVQLVEEKNEPCVM